MYSVGDTVIYTTYGICRVEDIVEKAFGGKTNSYYVLKPIHDAKSVIQVQTDNPIVISKLRNLLNADQIYELIHLFPTVEPYWIENENERKRKFADILRSGERLEVVGVMKSVHEHSKGLKDKGRKLHASDEQYYKDAERIIHEEISYVIGIERIDVPQFIRDVIEKNFRI